MASANQLFEAARAAMAQAHVPYSAFPVGAAILTETGRIFAGCNVENASYPEGWCAETSAIRRSPAVTMWEIAEVSAHQPSG